MSRGLVLLVALVVAPQATAGFIPLRPGDKAVVAGSHTACVIGTKIVICSHGGGKGSVAAALVAGGKTVAVLKDAGGKKTATLFMRNSDGFAAVKVSPTILRVVKLGVGQVGRVRGTTLDCAIVRSGAGAGKPTVYCSFDDKTGPVPGTHAILVSDDYAAVGRIQPSRQTTVIFKANQS